jgi:hypothetical protein
MNLMNFRLFRASRLRVAVPIIGNQLAKAISQQPGFGGTTMKHLSGIFLCLITAVLMTQQEGQSKSTNQAPPSVQPGTDLLVRALLAADTAQNKQEKPPVEDLKTVIDREIAKSATQVAELKMPGDHQAGDPLVLIDGAVYLKFGGTIYPMPGGGASGCFDPNSSAKLQQARLKFAEQVKTEPPRKN